MSDGDVVYILSPDPRLGRHIAHDPRSRQFPARKANIPQRDWRWRNYGRKLDQGGVGACTGVAAAHALNCKPLHRSGGKTFIAEDGIRFYGRATQLDDWPGEYPPDDTGTSALAICQSLQSLNLITSYEWAFGFTHGLQSLAFGPLLQGTYWTEDMSLPDSEGRVWPTGPDMGGHEYVWVGVEYRAKRQSSQNRSWFLNSWSADWGVKGYFWMTWKDHEELLARAGDLVRPIGAP